MLAPLGYYSIRSGQARATNMLTLERCVHALHAHTRSYAVTFARSHVKLNISVPTARIICIICIIWAPLAYYSIRPGQARATYRVSLKRCGDGLLVHTRSYAVTFAPSHGKLNISNPAACILCKICIIWAPLA